MIRYHGAWVVPIASPPLQHGWVDIDDGRVTAVGGLESHSLLPSPDREFQLSTSVILPGLVNAHTHLELSGLRGQVPGASSMPIWARTLMERVAGVPPDEDAISTAISEARRAGTALVGDVSNTMASVEALNRSALDALVFRELLGFDLDAQASRALVARAMVALDTQGTGHVRFALAAHAPYSVSAALFAALRGVVGRSGPLAVHVAESREEGEFLRTGTGLWRLVLEERGRWDPTWIPPDEGVVNYLDQLGWVAPDTLMVHGVHLTDRELEQLEAADVTLVTCPRSNQWTGAGTPAINRFYESSIRVAVGTDSLTSVSDLNLFAELREVRRLATVVPAAAILASATRVGAEALGFGDELGTIEPGRKASLIAVRLPAAPIPEGAADVEEWLLSGIQPRQITWLDDVTS